MQNREDSEPKRLKTEHSIAVEFDEIPLDLPDELLDESFFTFNQQVRSNQSELLLNPSVQASQTSRVAQYSSQRSILSSDLLNDQIKSSNMNRNTVRSMESENQENTIKTNLIQLDGIREDIDENILNETFSKFGSILHLSIQREKFDAIAFAFVEFSTNEAVDKILRNFIKFKK